MMSNIVNLCGLTYLIVSNITIYLVLLGTLQLATGAFRLLLHGGDSGYSWVSAHALCHNFGIGEVLNMSLLLEGAQSAQKYMRHHT